MVIYLILITHGLFVIIIYLYFFWSWIKVDTEINIKKKKKVFLLSNVLKNIFIYKYNHVDHIIKDDL